MLWPEGKGQGLGGWNRVTTCHRGMPKTGQDVFCTRCPLITMPTFCHYCRFTGKVPRLRQASISLTGEETALLTQMHPALRQWS